LLGYPQAALADTEHVLKVAREIGHAAVSRTTAGAIVQRRVMRKMWTRPQAT
jgi:hypothetical protein